MAYPSRRVYLGRLPLEVTRRDIDEFFKGYGRLADIRLMSGFGFVEFEHTRDAEDAVHDFNGKRLLGEPVIVEFAKEPRRRDPHGYGGGGGYGGGYGGYERSGPRPLRRGQFRVIVSGISRETSWQDLKDFGREAGDITFADIDRDRPGEGILEYSSKDDMDNAIRKLDGRDLRGAIVRVDEAAPVEQRTGGRTRSPPPPPRRSSRSRSPRRDRVDRDRDYGRSRNDDDYHSRKDDHRRGYDERDDRRDREDLRERSPPRKVEREKVAEDATEANGGW